MSSPASQSAASSPSPPALRSMTGYAQARAAAQGWNLRISIRSVNHRFLDLHFRLPEGFEALEPRLRQMVRESVRRGHLDVTMRCEQAGPGSVAVNQEAAAAYLLAVNALRKQFGLQAEPDVASLLRLPGVIGPPVGALEEELGALEAAVAQGLGEALEQLNRMREREGAALRLEMSERLAAILRLAAQVQTLEERARPAFARRLESRLKELLAAAPLDPARLSQEAALAAERGDVTEELTRLASHARQFQSLLEGAADAGKKLDFLLQEMQREANTLLAKTPGSEEEGLRITQLGLDIKSEIEKLREQVQNIE